MASTERDKVVTGLKLASLEWLWNFQGLMWNLEWEQEAWTLTHCHLSRRQLVRASPPVRLANCPRQLLRCSSPSLLHGPRRVPKDPHYPLKAFSVHLYWYPMAPKHCPQALCSMPSSSQALGRRSSPHLQVSHWPPSLIKSETISFHLYQGAKNTNAVYLFLVYLIKQL